MAASLNSIVDQFCVMLNQSRVGSRANPGPDFGLVNVFLNGGLRLIERQLRVSSMVRVIQFYSINEPINSMQVPPDLLQIIDLYGNDQPIDHLSMREFMRMRRHHWNDYYEYGTNTYNEANPNWHRHHHQRYYCRTGAELLIWPPLPPKHSSLVLNYFGTFTEITDPTQGNELTSSMPDILLYAALVRAADYYRMDQYQQWEQTLGTLLQSAQDQEYQLDALGGSSYVASPHYRY